LLNVTFAIITEIPTHMTLNHGWTYYLYLGARIEIS